MDDQKFLPFILRSKLHQPPIHENDIHRQHLLDRLDRRLQRPLTLVVAPAGYGKTSLVARWLADSSTPSAWVSLDKNDNDLRLFLNYFLAAVRTIFPDTVQEILAMTNALTLPPISTLTDSLINELDRFEKTFILVLDDFHLIKDDSVLDLLARLLHHPPQALHLVLIGRRDPFLPISTMRASRRLTEIRTQDLRFDEKEVAAFLTQEMGAKIDASTALALEERTEGWVTGLRLVALSMRHRGDIDPKLLDQHVEAQYVMEYLFTEVFSQKPAAFSRFLLTSAILDRFCGPICEALNLPDQEKLNGEVSGWDFIAWLKKENIFLVPLDAENRWFRFHHLFQKLLLNLLKRRLGQEDINALHIQASAWFAENGLIEEALNHALAAGNTKAAARLVAKHGFDLVSQEQWPTLERWLKLLPEESLHQDPELIVLLAWAHLVFSRLPELMPCLDRAEALFSDLTRPSATGMYLLGNIEAMRAFQYYLSAEGERAVVYAQSAIENMPRQHRWPRIFVSAVWAVACQMIGESGQAKSIIENMTVDESLRGGTSEVYLLASPCFFHWIAADLAAILRITARLQRIYADLRNPWTLGHVLHFSGIVHYHLNQFDAAEEKMLPLVTSPYLQHTWNFAHSAFALALIYQAQDRKAEANELAESAISFALETNNTATLKLARAFRVELALRQGHFAEAFHWAKQFVAMPFQTMYRFYVPQLTLAKVLLAQDTSNSREQAADLLRQLYEFVTSTHNRCFQIDVLALQALLHDSQKNESAALEALTGSLALAEPGGFIRLFLDLGPSMADLLKRLQKQNVAVDYIEKILAAFEQEGKQRGLPEAADQPTESPHLPISGSSSHSDFDSPELVEGRIPNSDLHTSPFPIPPVFPSMVESLTNRELDVMELVAQRLSNQEIADKLHISITTVKSHIYNIYGKLAVNKRREAVEKAQSLGILSVR